MTTSAKTSKLPPNPRPIRFDPTLVESVVRELRNYAGDTLKAAQTAVQEVVDSGATGSFEVLIGLYQDAISAAVGDEYVEPSDAPVTDEHRALMPPRGGPLRLDPDLARGVEAILEPYEGDDLARAQDAVLRVFRGPASGSFAQLLDAYREAIEESVTAPMV